MLGDYCLLLSGAAASHALLQRVRLREDEQGAGRTLRLIIIISSSSSSSSSTVSNSSSSSSSSIIIIIIIITIIHAYTHTYRGSGRPTARG